MVTIRALKREGIDTPSAAAYLVANYGTQTPLILEQLAEISAKDAKLRLLIAELRFGLNYESVYTALDFFSRRTGRLYFDIESVKDYHPQIIEAMTEALKWDEGRISKETEAVQKAVYEAYHFPPQLETV